MTELEKMVVQLRIEIDRLNTKVLTLELQFKELSNEVGVIHEWKLRKEGV